MGVLLSSSFFFLSGGTHGFLCSQSVSFLLCFSFFVLFSNTSCVFYSFAVNFLYHDLRCFPFGDTRGLLCSLSFCLLCFFLLSFLLRSHVLFLLCDMTSLCFITSLAPFICWIWF